MKLYPEIENLLNELSSEKHLITESRKQELEKFAATIQDAKTKFGKAEIIVICTHNSRRSHLGQVMLKAAAAYKQIDGIQTYSGGTEATAFNPRMLLALQNAGFRINQLDTSKNPKYYIPISDSDFSLDIFYSKRYSENYNPQKDYIAVMVCSQADEACPFVEGAFKRISLPYDDPKDFDGTEKEAEAYNSKIREIGREMYYVAEHLN